MKKALLISILFLINLSLFSQEINFEKGTWEDANQKAQLAEKYIFLDAYASWCGPCKWMAKNTFTNDTVGAFFNDNFINCKIDMEKGEGVALAKKYAVSAYPTLLFFNTKGELVHRVCGGLGVKELMEVANVALTGNNLKKIKEGYDKNRTPEITKNYIEALENACLSADAEKVGKDFFASLSLEKLYTTENWDLINNLLKDTESKEFKYLLENRNSIGNTIGKGKVEDKIFRTYAEALGRLIVDKNESGYQNLKKKIKETKFEKADKVILYSEMRYYKFNKSWNNYANATISYYDIYPTKDANTLNSIAWSFYEQIFDKNQLKYAENWAKTACEINENYSFLDTYACVLSKLNKKEEAIKMAEKAIEVGKKAGEDVAETEQLLSKLKGATKF
jgi:thioredoxin-related protein